MAKTTNKQFQCPTHWTIAQRLDHYTVKSGGPDACWQWMASKDKAGYGYLKLQNGTRKAHRLAWEVANGPIPEGQQVLHDCPSGDNPACVNPDHLWLGTNAENHLDKLSKKRQARGERSGNAKLTEDAVRAIRDATDSHNVIAARFNVSRRLIRQIKRGEGWNHVC